MNASTDDRRALRQALTAMLRRAERAVLSLDTEETKARLLDVRASVLVAYELAQAIEDNTRNAALREVETRLEQRVGMEAEGL